MEIIIKLENRQNLDTFLIPYKRTPQTIKINSFNPRWNKSPSETFWTRLDKRLKLISTHDFYTPNKTQLRSRILPTLLTDINLANLIDSQKYTRKLKYIFKSIFFIKPITL